MPFLSFMQDKKVSTIFYTTLLGISNWKLGFYWYNDIYEKVPKGSSHTRGDNFKIIKIEFLLQDVTMWHELRQKEEMLAKVNYSYQKHQKEMAKKKKKEEKKQSKLDKKNIQSNANSEQTSE